MNEARIIRGGDSENRPAQTTELIPDTHSNKEFVETEQQRFERLKAGGGTTEEYSEATAQAAELLKEQVGEPIIESVDNASTDPSGRLLFLLQDSTLKPSETIERLRQMTASPHQNN